MTTDSRAHERTGALLLRTETTCAATFSTVAMPCAAAVNCRLKQDTPGPPRFTCHKCRSCQGYLHGICGVPDPMGNSDMKRVCEACNAGASPKAKGKPSTPKHTPSAPKDKPVLKPTVAKHQPRGADKRKRLSIEAKGTVIETSEEKRMKSPCRQEIMVNFHLHAVRLSGAWGPPPEDIHIQ